MRSLRRAPSVLPALLLLLLVLLVAAGHGAVITGACDRDHQCGGGMCCAVSLWIRSLRMCTPMGNLGEECHPLSHRDRSKGCTTMALAPQEPPEEPGDALIVGVPPSSFFLSNQMVMD
ncbi:Prokineticin Bv8-like peptide 2 [Willisornis vidua]|uniref:Prokineticin Bv8-like peptide 2 n=1 Tax=Willisornis vidua TaxID=1566151 RepID=A0ABQ9CRZ4_9PASS|nr:Prokineticin Bv8-like peptide 2 [Willisornis vidua]